MYFFTKNRKIFFQFDHLSERLNLILILISEKTVKYNSFSLNVHSKLIQIYNTLNQQP